MGGAARNSQPFGDLEQQHALRIVGQELQDAERALQQAAWAGIGQYPLHRGFHGSVPRFLPVVVLRHRPTLVK